MITWEFNPNHSLVTLRNCQGLVFGQTPDEGDKDSFQNLGTNSILTCLFAPEYTGHKMPASLLHVSVKWEGQDAVCHGAAETFTIVYFEFQR